MQNFSDFSYFLLNIRKVLAIENFLAHFYVSNFVNRLFLQRSHTVTDSTLLFSNQNITLISSQSTLSYLSKTKES